MVTPENVPPEWLKRLDLSNWHLAPAASLEAISQLEINQKIQLPDEHREFLCMADGGILKVRNGEIELFSVCDYDNPGLTLKSMNENVDVDIPLYFIGSDDYGLTFGYVLEDVRTPFRNMSAAVCVDLDGDVCLRARSFKELGRVRNIVSASRIR